MVSACAGVRSIEGRRARLPGLLLDDLEGDEISAHKRAVVSKEFKESDKEEDKYQKTKHFSRKLGLLLFLACAATVVTISFDGSVYGNYIRSSSEEADYSENDVFSTDRAQESEGLIPGCKTSKSSWKASVFGGTFGASFTNCYLPKGASILSWMRYEYPHNGMLKIGMINVRREEQRKWELFTRDWGKLYLFPFRSVSSLGLTWNDLYPEWIDEEELSEIPKCPHIPLPSVSRGVSLDVVITKVPGACSGKESRRDIRRLQLMLAAATVASETQTILVMIVSKCRPPVNLFTCDELLEVKDDVWLYQVDFQKLRKRLAVPLGSCELVLPLKNVASNSLGKSWTTKKSSVQTRREAYATILHTDGVYVCGAIVMGQSIKMIDAKRDLVALVDAGITLEQRQGLTRAGWKLHDIERIRNPKSDPLKYNAWNYSKFRLWQVIQYDRIVFIDADLLVLQNLDALFNLPQLSATGNDKYLFNSGVMVIEPSNCTFDLLMQQINDVESYNGGDQGFLNEIFPWWHRIPKRMNYLKFFWSNMNSTEERRQEMAEKNGLFQANPPVLYVLHYLGLKPWTCFRDYDCNWNTNEAYMYASDVAHARWWKVHDSMSEELQQHCLLSTKRKAALEWDRRQAEVANYEDKHWKINITDSRLHICNERFCYWESMLWHWGEPENQTLPSGGQRKSVPAVGS